MPTTIHESGCTSRQSIRGTYRSPRPRGPSRNDDRSTIRGPQTHRPPPRIRRRHLSNVPTALDSDLRPASRYPMGCRTFVPESTQPSGGNGCDHRTQPASGDICHPKRGSSLAVSPSGFKWSKTEKAGWPWVGNHRPNLRAAIEQTKVPLDYGSVRSVDSNAVILCSLIADPLAGWARIFNVRAAFPARMMHGSSGDQ